MCDQDVLRFDISVYEPGLVSVIQCLGDLNRDGVIGSGLVDLGFLQEQRNFNFPCP